MIELFEPGDLPEYLVQRCPMEAAYIQQFAGAAAQDLIRNVTTSVRALAVADALMPVTVDSPQPGNCYVVSPTAAYSDYARYELQVLPNPFARSGLGAVVGAFDRWSRRVRLDRVVHVNNWMLSTNLYGCWKGEGLEDVTAGITEHFPDRAIALRSLNTFSNRELIQRGAQNGCLLLPSRQDLHPGRPKGQLPRVLAAPRFQARRPAFRSLRLSCLPAGPTPVSATL